MALQHAAVGGRPPGDGDPVPPAPVPPPAPGQPKTYRELFSDEANTPPAERIGNYLQGYRFVDGGAGPVPAPVTLRDQTAVLSDRQPMAFMCLTGGPGGAREVAIVHRMMKYMDMPGEAESGYHDRVLGLLGDIMPHQYPAIEIPSSMFHLVGTAVRVPTTDAMNALIPTWDHPQVPLGPYHEADPETEVVRPRNIQLVPCYYASMLVHRRGVTAKGAYQELYGAMQARNEVAVCQDVLTWLKAACTARGGEGLQNNVPVVFHQTTPVHLPPEVYRYMIGKVKGDLPALATPDAMTAEVTGTLAGALRALTAARGGEGAAEDRTTREPKAIQEFYRETYKTLLRFGNVTTPDAVAPVWRRLANSTKGEQHTILVQEFQRVCMARGLSTEFYVPVVTAGLKQMVTGLQFVGHGVDDLSTGCQPFLVSFTGSTNHRQALESATIGNQLALGEHNASLTDYVTLRASEKIKFPRDVMEVGVTLGRYAVVCQALFQGTGPDNPLVNLMWKLFADIQNSAPSITDKFQQIAHQPAVAGVFYACILRAVQVRVYDYLHAVSINVSEDHTGVETPDFRSMVSDLRHGTFPHSSNWVPIPVEYREPARAGGGGSGASRAPPSAVPTGGSSVSSERTGVSSLTTDATPRVPMIPIDNPNNDAEFRAIAVRPGGTRPILRDYPPPQNDAGRVFCVSWWLRGSCYPNCRRRETHAPFASAGERTRLLAFCRERLAAPAATAGGGT